MLMLTTLAMKIATDAMIPHFVKVPAIFSNFLCRGVLELVSNLTSLDPLLLPAPTQQTTALPTPVVIKVYERRNGSGFSFWFSSVATDLIIGLSSLV